MSARKQRHIASPKEASNRKLLRNKILSYGIEDGWGHKDYLRKTLEAAAIVEATQATDYYYRETPEEQTFDITVLPNLCYECPNPIFFEGDLPIAAFGAGGEGRLRIGLLLERDVAPASWVRGDTQYVVKVCAFSETEPEDEGEVSGPKLWWMIPVNSDGLAVTDEDGNIPMINVERRNPLVMAMLRANRRKSEQIQQEILQYAELERDHLYAALFALSSLNVATGSSALASLKGAKEGATTYQTLEMEPLKKKLNRKGNAKQVGLAHALTVCRTEFY